MSDNRWLAKDEGVPRGRAYDERFSALESSGQYLHGEADRLISLSPATVLDAGCGTGRIAIELARRGVDVVGVDLDPTMLAVARDKAPELDWREGDLALFDLDRQFDVVVAAGNVLIFLTPGSEALVTERMAAHVAEGGHLVAGFSLADDHVSRADHHRHCAAAGLAHVEDLATWEGDPYDGGDYIVSIHRRVEGRSKSRDQGSRH